jgi:hypothetical protein
MAHESKTNGFTLVLFSDWRAQLEWLVSAYEHAGYRVVPVFSLAELNALPDDGVEFFVFDVAAETLLPALQALRVDMRWRTTTALVRAERLDDVAALAGVCPTYRALICHHADLLTLLAHHISQPPSAEKRHLI